MPHASLYALTGEAAVVVVAPRLAIVSSSNGYCDLRLSLKASTPPPQVIASQPVAENTSGNRESVRLFLTDYGAAATHTLSANHSYLDMSDVFMGATISRLFPG
jgi:hypothetical protein